MKSGRDEPMCGCSTHVHGNNARNLLSFIYLKVAKMLCLSYYLFSYVFSSTKLENKRAEQVFPGSIGWQ
jgi:hypothetical protein